MVCAINKSLMARENNARCNTHEDVHERYNCNAYIMFPDVVKHLTCKSRGNSLSRRRSTLSWLPSARIDCVFPHTRGKLGVRVCGCVGVGLWVWGNVGVYASVCVWVGGWVGAWAGGPLSGIGWDGWAEPPRIELQSPRSHNTQSWKRRVPFQNVDNYQNRTVQGNLLVHNQRDTYFWFPMGA